LVSATTAALASSSSIHQFCCWQCPTTRTTFSCLTDPSSTGQSTGSGCYVDEKRLRRESKRLDGSSAAAHSQIRAGRLFRRYKLILMK
jgi:hypothetical protein